MYRKVISCERGIIRLQIHLMDLSSSTTFAVVYSEIPRGGGGSANLLSGQFFSENCMETKIIGPGRKKVGTKGQSCRDRVLVCVHNTATPCLALPKIWYKNYHVIFERRIMFFTFLHLVIKVPSISEKSGQKLNIKYRSKLSTNHDNKCKHWGISGTYEFHFLVPWQLFIVTNRYGFLETWLFTKYRKSS